MGDKETRITQGDTGAPDEEDEDSFLDEMFLRAAKSGKVSIDFLKLMLKGKEFHIEKWEEKLQKMRGEREKLIALIAELEGNV
jgi:hypothetical protein